MKAINYEMGMKVLNYINKYELVDIDDEEDIDAIIELIKEEDKAKELYLKKLIVERTEVTRGKMYKDNNQFKAILLSHSLKSVLKEV